MRNRILLLGAVVLLGICLAAMNGHGTNEPSASAVLPATEDARYAKFCTETTEQLAVEAVQAQFALEQVGIHDSAGGIVHTVGGSFKAIDPRGNCAWRFTTYVDWRKGGGS